MVRKKEELHSLDVVRVKCLFMESSPDRGNTDTFSSCNSSHIGSGILFHSHISASTGFWVYVDWDYFAYLSENYTPSKRVTLF
jgi:hypothetical protein